MSEQGFTAAVSLSKLERPKSKIADDAIIGKDVLELLTGAMYVDPLSIYREYVQNATDGVDEAVAAGLMERTSSRIEVWLDDGSRSIRIRDNGIGVSNRLFTRVLTAIGGSHKRGSLCRGFRGVGRLSGLGYCQELVFRSRSKGDAKVMEMTWDGRRLKQILNDGSWDGNLVDAIREITACASVPSDQYPARFFEVELRKVVRCKNDVLLNNEVVTEYISQVCPVPFRSNFKFSRAINNYLAEHGLGDDYNVHLNGSEDRIYRPHGSEIEFKQNVSSPFSGIRFFKFQGISGDLEAVGWVVDHDYVGAIPKGQGIHGIRFRVGNIQVGGAELAADHVFPEPRFNSWSVGEVHVLGKKITPNGRRDHFEQNVHFENLIGQIAPIGIDIARRCRTLSLQRNKLKAFELMYDSAVQLVKIATHASTPRSVVDKAIGEVEVAIGKLSKIAADKSLGAESCADLQRRVSSLEKKLGDIGGAYQITSDPLRKVPAHQRKVCADIFAWLYEFVPDKATAKKLVDQMSKRIVRKYARG